MGEGASGSRKCCFHCEETTVLRDRGGVGLGEMIRGDSGRPGLGAAAGLPQGAWSFL